MALEVAAIGVPTLVVLLSARDHPVQDVVAGLVGSAVLPLRHRWPAVVVVVCLPGLVGGLGWGPLLVAMFALGRARPQFPALAPWVVLATATALAPVLVRQPLSISSFLLAAAFAGLGSGTPAELGALVATRQQLAASLRELKEARAGELAARAETARAEERARIAREIHDAVGHHATLIAVESAAMAATATDPAVRESATRLRSLAKEALTEMRAALGLLADPATRSTGLDALPELVARARESGMNVDLHSELGSDGDRAARVGRAAYRVVQEALTNASKHAPGARVRVRLAETPDELRISVVNAPEPGPVAPLIEPGGDGSGGGSGLAGLSERVHMVGGRLEAEPTADGGFAVHVSLPLLIKTPEQHA